MIIVNIQGGLGNQLQQYALYRKYVSMGVDARIDISWFDDDNQKNMAAPRKLELDYFDHIEYEACTQEEKARLTGGDGLIGKLKRKISKLTGLRLVKIYDENGIHYDENILGFKDKYVIGYFANEYYYNDIMPKLREELRFPIEKSINKDLLMEYTNRMNGENSVSIHIRRGDYLDEANQALYGGNCTREYYDGAVKFILDRVDNPVFYIFSDDNAYALEYASSLKDKGYKAEVIDINHGEESFFDIYLMTQCKHVIAANSTFSFWGARLNAHDGIIKIRPKKHRNNLEFSEEMREWWKGWTFIDSDGNVV